MKNTIFSGEITHTNFDISHFSFPGVQIAYFAIIGTQLSMIMLSIVLMFGIYRVSGIVITYMS